MRLPNVSVIIKVQQAAVSQLTPNQPQTDAKLPKFKQPLKLVASNYQSLARLSFLPYKIPAGRDTSHATGDRYCIPRGQLVAARAFLCTLVAGIVFLQAGIT